MSLDKAIKQIEGSLEPVLLSFKRTSFLSGSHQSSVVDHLALTAFVEQVMMLWSLGLLACMWVQVLLLMLILLRFSEGVKTAT